MAKSDVLLLSAPLAGDALPGGVCPSLSNVTNGSFLRHHGVSVSVLDPSVDLGEGPPDPAAVLARTVDAVIEANPRLVGLSCMSTVEGRFALAFAEALGARAPNLPVVLGGVWATGSPDEILARAPAVDAVVAGPGERSMLALAEHGLSRPEAVEGLVWRDGGGLARVAPTTQVEGPVPLKLDLLKHPERYDIFCWITSRGCPYHCAFCTETLTSPGFSCFPADRVAADVEALTATGPGWYLWICDPLFGAKRAHLARTCDALGQSPHRFLIESRVDVLHPDDVPRLAAAGCDLVYFGVEAVSRRSLVALDKIRDDARAHAQYLEGARALVEVCVRNDVLPVFGLVQPAPGDGPEDLREALDFLEELKAIVARLGSAANGLQPCFHAFPLRFDRGAPYDARMDELARGGMTLEPVKDPLVDDRVLCAASPTVSKAEAEAFRVAVRGLNSRDPVIMRRLYNSYPRPFVEFGR